MSRTIALLSAIGLAVAAPATESIGDRFARLTSDLCKVSAKDGHPAIDLNTATLSEDTSLDSTQHPGTTFKLQVCKGLVYSDSKCTAGSTVCEVEDGKTAEVYGYLDTINVSWVNSQILLQMRGGDCAKNPAMKTKSSVLFECSQPADEAVTIKGESQYGCYVEFRYATPHACTSGPSPPAPPTGDKYRCTAGVCEKAETGATLQECQSVCKAPPGGNKYKCTDGKCTPSETGATLEQCQGVCKAPAGDKFKCTEMPNGPICERSTEGNLTEAGCNSTCKYTFICRSGECTGILNGSGHSLDYCKQECHPSDITYKCANDQCIPVQDGSGVAKSACEAACHPTTTKYRCDSGNCVTSSTGVTLEECQSVCKSDDKKYKCTDGKCEEAQDGVDLKTCQAVCTKTTPTFDASF